MNRIYKLVFNRHLGTVQVVSEIASSKGCGPGRAATGRAFKPVPSAVAIALGAIGMGLSTPLWAACGTSSAHTSVSTASSSQCSLAQGESVAVTPSGSIQWSGNGIWGIFVPTGRVTGSISNAGTIAVSGVESRGIGTMVGSTVNGGISNTGTITAGGHGIEIGYANVSGSTAVNGDPSGVAIFNSGEVLTNGTTFAANDESGLRIARNAQINGNVVNSGTFEGTYRGITVSGAGSAINGQIRNSGAIAGRDYGVYNEGRIASGLDNTGNISGNGGGTVASFGLYNASGGDIGDIGNTGTIAGAGSGLYNEGTIAGINNAGTIAGSDGHAIFNTGTIVSGVVNSGTLEGDVALGTAALTLTGQGGRVIGDTTASGITVDGTFSSEGNAASGTGLTVTGGGNLAVRAGDAWTASGGVVVGDSGGDGTLDIASGGTVGGTYVALGQDRGSVGSSVVDGADSRLEAGDLYLGGLAGGTSTGGTAVLTLSNGGALGLHPGTAYATGPSAATSTSSSTVYLGYGAGSRATLNIGAAAGDSAVGAGVLDAGHLVFGQGAGTLVFNHTASDYLFAPAISGNGMIDVLSGTTILTGDSSSFSGNTSIVDGAILQVGNGGTTGAFAGTVDNAGALIFNRSDDSAFGGAISGAGALVKTGSGTLATTGANTYAGTTTVAQGALQAGNAGTFSPLSAYTVANGALLDLAGHDQAIAALTNAGTVRLDHAAAGTVLTVSGDYVGGSGTLVLNAMLGDSASVTDRLVVGGNVSGSTTMQVVNQGGLGALTTGAGIEVVDVAGTSTNDAFALAGTHVDAGAYAYSLYKGDAQGTGEDWYLRSTSPDAIAYREEVPLHAALPAQVREADMALLGNLHQRVGETPNAQSGTDADGMSWVRVLGGSTHIQQQGTVGQRGIGQSSGVQLGSDVWQHGGWRAGLYAGALSSTYDVSGFASGTYGKVGSNRLRSTAAGAYGTWTGEGGSYVDLVVQQARHRAQVNSGNGQSRSKADATLASIEVGVPFALGRSAWTLEPQAQVIYQHLSFDDAHLTGATTVGQDGDNGWRYRVGLRLQGDYGNFQPYVRANAYHASNGNDITIFSTDSATTSITSAGSYSASELAAGLTYAVNPQAQLYLEAGHTFGSSRDDTRVSQPLEGSLGMRIRW